MLLEIFVFGFLIGRRHCTITPTTTALNRTHEAGTPNSNVNVTGQVIMYGGIVVVIIFLLIIAICGICRKGHTLNTQAGSQGSQLTQDTEDTLYSGPMICCHWKRNGNGDDEDPYGPPMEMIERVRDPSLLVASDLKYTKEPSSDILTNSDCYNNTEKTLNSNTEFDTTITKKSKSRRRSSKSRRSSARKSLKSTASNPSPAPHSAPHVTGDVGRSNVVVETKSSAGHKRSRRHTKDYQSVRDVRKSSKDKHSSIKKATRVESDDVTGLVEKTEKNRTTRERRRKSAPNKIQ